MFIVGSKKPGFKMLYIGVGGRGFQGIHFLGVDGLERFTIDKYLHFGMTFLG